MKTNFANRYIKAAAKLQGFTVIELLISVTIVSILLAVAVPSFNNMIRDNRVLSGANSLAAGVAFAKSEAVGRGRMVTLCPSTDGLVCDLGATFDKGWVVMVELPTVIKLATPDADTSVGVNGVLMGGGEIQKSVVTKTSASGNNWVRFSPRGITDEEVNFEVKPSTCNTGYAFQEVNVGIAGRVSITKKSC